MVESDNEHVTLQSASPSELPYRLGRNLAQRRKEMGLTQAVVAELMGVETETLSRFERGKHVPSLLTLEKIAAVLQTTCADLLQEQAPEPGSSAVMLEAGLSRLKGEDREFALELFRQCCTHLSKPR